MKNLLRMENEKREFLKAIDKYKLALKNNGIIETDLDIEKIKNQVIDSSFIISEKDYEEKIYRFIVKKDGKNLYCYTYNNDGIALVEGYYCSECGVPLRLSEVIDNRDVCECGCDTMSEINKKVSVKSRDLTTE